MLCSYPGDAGSSGRPNGGCDAHPYVGSITKAPAWHPGDDLETMMKQQADPKYQHGKYGASGYNEVITGVLWWDHSLPWAVEAFVFVGEGYPPEKKQRMFQAHGAFLKWYGLSAADVPLLDYQAWAPGLEPARNEGSPAFVDVSK